MGNKYSTIVRRKEKEEKEIELYNAVEQNLNLLLEHSKHYIVENTLIILPDAILSHPEFNLLTNKGNLNEIKKNDSLNEILDKYKIVHINNISDKELSQKLQIENVNDKNIKNILITNLLKYDNDISDKSNKKLLRILKKDRKKKNTNIYLDHYCSLLKNMLNNLEYKWDWHNKSLMADLSHQLKTPLTGLLTGIQILSKSKQSKNDSYVIEYLFKSCLELSTHINNITDYYFINQNDIKLNYEIIHIENILLNIKKVYKTQLYEKRNRFVYSIDDTSNKIIMQDNEKLFKILYNLINNSIKFTEHGYIFIYAFVSKDGKRYYFRVYDNGTKVDDKDKEYLFDPFYKFDERKEHLFRQGLGLGLSICKKIINAMGGSIYFKKINELPISNLLNNTKTKKKFTNCVEFWFPTDIQYNQMEVNDTNMPNKKLSEMADMVTNAIHNLDDLEHNGNNNNNNNDEFEELYGKSIESEPITDVELNNDDLDLDLKKDIDKFIETKKKIHKKRKLPKLPQPKTIINSSVDNSLTSSEIEQIRKKVKKILIIEDHKINSSLIKMMIQNIISSEIQVDIQNNSRLAYDNIINGDYDYILLDLRMPEVSGFDILNKLNKNKYFGKINQSKIIVITALLSDVVDELKEKYPNIDILYKPIDVNDLQQYINN